MQWNGLYKEKNPTERGNEHLTREREREREKERERERERAQHHSVNTSLLFINEKPNLGLA